MGTLGMQVLPPEARDHFQQVLTVSKCNFFLLYKSKGVNHLSMKISLLISPLLLAEELPTQKCSRVLEYCFQANRF